MSRTQSYRCHDGCESSRCQRRANHSPAAGRLRSAPWGLTAPKPSAETEDKAFVRCGGRDLTTNLEGAGNQSRFPGATEEPCAPKGGRSRWHEYEHGPGARITVVLADRRCPLRG